MTRTARREAAKLQATPSVVLPGNYWEKDREPLRAGNSVPDWELALSSQSRTNARGNVKLSGLRGERTLVVFWAFWCDTWKDATRDLKTLRAELEKQNVKVVVVSVDASQQPVARRAFESGDIWFPVAIDKDSKITAQWGVRRVPTAFLLEGTKIRARWEGFPNRKQLLDVL